MSAAITASATAIVPTASASRYLQQLCKHWSHKFAVAFDSAHGVIPFDDGAVATLDVDEGTLTVRIDVPDAGQLARMQRVVAEHLDRFAFREAPLTFEWR